MKIFNFNELRSIINESIKRDKSKENFLEIIECAERIKSQNPSSKLSDGEFTITGNEILQEKSKTPGTKEYERLNSILKNLSISFKF